MRVLRLNQRRAALLCAAVLIALSTVTVLRQQGILFGQHLTSDSNNRVETAKSTAPAVTTDLPKDTPTITAPTDAAAIEQPTPEVPAEQLAQEPAAPADQPEQAAPVTPTTPAPAKTTGDYHHVAQIGDSYTALARTAIAEYAATHTITLSPDQALTAEVHVTNIAGAPELDINQEVTITQATIAEALEIAGVAQTDMTPKKDKPVADSNLKATSTQPASAVAVETTVQAGDSYTVLARTAIANYVATQKLRLNTAQLVAAESFLTVQAGTPLLNEGQQVTIASQDVATAVATALALTTDEQAAWQLYI